MKEQIRYDVKMGILHEWWKYLFVGMLILLVCAMEAGQAAECVKQKFFTEPSFGNYLIKWMRGIQPIQYTNRERQMAMPFEWMALQMSYLILIAKYTATDLEQNGYKLFIRIGKKSIWWYGKCVWVFLSTLLYYGLFYGILSCFAIATGSLQLEPTSEIWVGGIGSFTNANGIIQIFLLPVLVSTVIGLGQIFLELVVSPVIAIIVSCGYLLASLYWCNPFLLGNYSMIERNSAFIGEKGVSSIIGVTLCVAAMMTICFLGNKYIKKMER